MAEKKYMQLLGSILKYKEKMPRFKLFGRFLQLYDELSDADLKLYVDLVHSMYKCVLNFSILEQDDIVLLPTVSACAPSLMTMLLCRVVRLNTSK